MKNTAVARPYAKAAFEFALEHNELQVWGNFLNVVASLTQDKKVAEMLHDPNMSSARLLEMYSLTSQRCGNPYTQNFLRIIIGARRLVVLPEIAESFENLRRDYDKTIVADVIAYSDLSQEQQENIKKSLKIRLKRDIELKYRVDKSILGGAIIRAGDLVIDGSVRSRLEKLRQQAAE